MRTRPHICSLALLGWACGEPSDIQKLTFDAQPLCEGEAASCVNAGTESSTIDGVRLIHKRVPGHPLVAMRVLFAAEAATGSELWSQQLALALLQNGGPRRFTTTEWDAELLELSSTIGTTTGLDYSGLTALAPAPNWRIVWELMVEAATAPSSASYDLENSRGVLQTGYMLERDDPGAAAAVEAWSRLFAGHAYNLPRESQAALAAVQTWDIEPAWQRMLTKDRLLVVVVGDVESDEIAAAVSDTLGGLPAEQPPNGPLELASAPAVLLPSEASVLRYPDSPTWQVHAYFKGPLAGGPGLASLEVGMNVLGKRLFDRVRVERGLAYSAGASLSRFRQSIGMVTFASDAPSEALPLAREIIAELKATEPSERELAAAKRTMLTRLVTSNVTAPQLSSSLGDWQLTFGSRFAIEEYARTVQDVTAGDVSVSLDTYLRDVAIAAAGGGSEINPAQLNLLFVTP